MKNYKIYCPSYKRSNIAISHTLFLKDDFYYVIREEEQDAYARLGLPLILIPKGTVSNIAQTRNWILENKITDYVVMCDDDLKNISHCSKRAIKPLTPYQISDLIYKGFQMSEDAQCGYFGLNVNQNPMAYSINKPFQFSRVILGPFTGILDTTIRYDESLPLKEDKKWGSDIIRPNQKNPDSVNMRVRLKI